MKKLLKSCEFHKQKSLNQFILVIKSCYFEYLEEKVKMAENDFGISNLNIRDEENLRIKEDLRDHLLTTQEKLITLDGWDLVNMPKISERELLESTNQNDLENDEQTLILCRFISISSNFASLDFKTRLKKIPNVMIEISDLLKKIQEETKEFAEIANVLQELIQSYVKIVINTKNKMNRALPHLEESTAYMLVLQDALTSDSNKVLSKQDLEDVDTALNYQTSGIFNLMELAKESKHETEQLDIKITGLREQINSKIVVTENRIEFSKLLPKTGAALGMWVGGAAVQTVVN